MKNIKEIKQDIAGGFDFLKQANTIITVKRGKDGHTKIKTVKL